MKRITVLLVLIAVLCSCTVFFVCCNNDDDTKLPSKNYDLSLRENTQYGLYWYGDDATDKLISQEDMPLKYYDPSKPTLIYAHGWKMESDVREDLVMLDKTISKTGGEAKATDYVKELKALGYNVAIFDWYDYARELENLYKEIWTVGDASTLDEEFKGSNYESALLALEGRTFAGEFARSVAAVMKDAQGKEVIFVGHSYGSQIVTAGAYTLFKLVEDNAISNSNILPSRIALADPYMPGEVMNGKMDLIEEDLTNTYVTAKDANCFAYFKENGVAIDIYEAMVNMNFNLMSISSAEIRNNVKNMILQNTAYVVQKGLTKAYGIIGDVHNVSRDWVLSAIVEGKKGNMQLCTPNPSMSAQELMNYVGKQYNQNYAGFDPTKTTMELVIK